MFKKKKKKKKKKTKTPASCFFFELNTGLVLSSPAVRDPRTDTDSISVRGDARRRPCRRRRRRRDGGAAAARHGASSSEPSSWRPSPLRRSSCSYYSSTATALNPQTPPPRPATATPRTSTSSSTTRLPRSGIRRLVGRRSPVTGPRARRWRGWGRRPRALGGALRSWPACGSAR